MNIGTTRRGLLAGAVALAAAPTPGRAQVAPTVYPDAAASDPVKLGWMVGSPPPPDKIIRFAEAGMRLFPQSRWAFSNVRQVQPTVVVPRGERPAQPFKAAIRDDLDAVTFAPMADSGFPDRMTWGQSLGVNYTDGILVLHRGRIVYERYFGALDPARQHLSFSVTKSFVGTLAATLIEEGKLDPAAPAASYVPELKGSGFGDASIRELLDMRTGIRYSEDYVDIRSDVAVHALAGNIVPRPSGWTGPEGFCAYLTTVGKAGPHGGAFGYKTAITDALAWVLARVTGRPLQTLLHERLWSRLGMEQDGYMTVDNVGTVFAGGGLCATLRDLARFGELMRQGGKWDGAQLISAAVIADIERGGDRAAFTPAGYKLLPGASYRSQWWCLHNAHGAYSARGIHGQAIYIDPKAEVVIARLASHPLAANSNYDATSLPAYQAVAQRLMG